MNQFHPVSSVQGHHLNYIEHYHIHLNCHRPSPFRPRFALLVSLTIILSLFLTDALCPCHVNRLFHILFSVTATSNILRRCSFLIISPSLLPPRSSQLSPFFYTHFLTSCFLTTNIMNHRA